MPGDLTIPARVEAGVSFGPPNAGPSRSGRTRGMKWLHRDHSLRDN